MNPFNQTIKFKTKKPNHFYAIKENNQYVKIENPIIGQKVYEIPSISGGEEKPRLLLEIPIPLCKEHFDSHDGKFGVTTCNGWDYIVIPCVLGSLTCRECSNALFIPMPFLRSANLYSADLSSADLSSANLSSANLYSANLYSADLSLANLYSANLYSADLSSANLSSALNVDKAYWNKFTIIDEEYKKLLSKDRFME